jgi:phage-related protein
MAQFKKSQEEISEKVGNMALTLQNILAPAFTWVSERISGAIDLLKPLTNFLQEHQTALQVLSGAFIGIGGVIAAYEIKTRAATLATTVLTAAEWLLDLAMEANPVGIVVVAIAAFVGMLIMAYEKVGWFRDIVNATWDTILDFAHSAKEFLTPFLELWDKLSGAVQSFKKHIVDGARSLLDGFLKPIKDFIESHKDLFDLLKKIF